MLARPNSHSSAENGDGDVVVARPMCSLVSCFRALRLQRDLGRGERERDSSFPGGVSSPLSASLLSPLARPGQFMKIKPIPPSVQNSWRAKMEREREGESRAIIANEL